MFNLVNYNITYSLELHPDLIAEITVGGSGGSGITSATALKAEYIRVVDETLQDPAGWRTQGYTFTLDSSGVSSGGLSGTPQTLKIILAPESTCMRAGITQGLSGYFYKSRHIMLNYNNWLTGGKSEMDIDRYRRYMINHEVGHALGRQHRVCVGDGKPAPVMMQMTRGRAHIAPCISNDRPTPADALTLSDVFWFNYNTYTLFRVIICVLVMVLIVATAYMLGKTIIRATERVGRIARV
jgi:Protein of unknown function (DUF3152)